MRGIPGYSIVHEIMLGVCTECGQAKKQKREACGVNESDWWGSVAVEGRRRNDWRLVAGLKTNSVNSSITRWESRKKETGKWVESQRRVGKLTIINSNKCVTGGPIFEQVPWFRLWRKNMSLHGRALSQLGDRSRRSRLLLTMQRGQHTAAAQMALQGRLVQGPKSGRGRRNWRNPWNWLGMGYECCCKWLEWWWKSLKERKVVGLGRTKATTGKKRQKVSRTTWGFGTKIVWSDWMRVEFIRNNQISRNSALSRQIFAHLRLDAGQCRGGESGVHCSSGGALHVRIRWKPTFGITQYVFSNLLWCPNAWNLCEEHSEVWSIEGNWWGPIWTAF